MARFFKCRIKAIRLHSLRLEYTKISEYTSPTPEKFRNTALQRCSATTAPSHRNPTSYASSPLHPDIQSGADERQTPLSGTAATVFDTKAAATTSARSSTSRPSAPRAIAFLQSGQAVTIVPAPVALNSFATERAKRSCCASEIAVLATEEPQQRACSRVWAGSSSTPTASITSRGWS